MDWSHIHVWWIKFQEGYLGNEEPQPHTRHPPPAPSPGFQCQEDKSPLLLAENTSGNLVGGRNIESQAAPLKELPHRLTETTPSELQHWVSSLKGTSGIQGGTEVFGIKAEAMGQLSARQKDRQKPLSLF